MDLAIERGRVEQGYPVSPGQARGVAHMKISRKFTPHGATWTSLDDNCIKQYLGWIPESDIAAILNRSLTAVHLRWSRDLQLTAPSKAPDILTAHRAAKALGIDSHKISHWVDKGLIPGRLLPGGRKIRLIPRISFLVFACSPKNWVYFDIQKIRDPKLKRLCALRSKKWGDEWWNTKRAAVYHGLKTQDIKRYIVLGRIQSFHLPMSLGGRHGNGNRKWSNHFVLKSDVEKMKVVHKTRNTPWEDLFTPGADRWLLKARDKMGMTFVHIGRTMRIGKAKRSPDGRSGTNYIIAGRYHYLKMMAQKKKSRAKA